MSLGNRVSTGAMYAQTSVLRPRRARDYHRAGDRRVFLRYTDQPQVKAPQLPGGEIHSLVKLTNR